MASGCYNSTVYDAVTGAIDFDTDTFYVMLVGAGYTFDKDAHAKRSDITSEVSGAGYTAGGQAIVPNVTKDNTNDRTSIVFPQVTWPASTVAAAEGAVYYKRRGGASTADELVGFNDFPAPITTSNGTLTLQATTINLNTPA